MLDSAQEGGYAYPAINCSSIPTLNAAMKGFADNKSDGIIQFSTGAGQFASGLNHKDSTKGTIILAEAAHALAEQYEVLIGYPSQVQFTLFHPTTCVKSKFRFG